jgi:hypothetical protein
METMTVAAVHQSSAPDTWVDTYSEWPGFQVQRKNLFCPNG